MDKFDSIEGFKDPRNGKVYISTDDLKDFLVKDLKPHSPSPEVEARVDDLIGIIDAASEWYGSQNSNFVYFGQDS